MAATKTSQKGRYLGGIRTLQHVHDRCIEEGDCLLWQGTTTSNRYPAATVNAKRVLLSRWVLKQAGRTFGANQVATATCGNRLCLNPEHLEIITRATSVRRSYVNRRHDYPSRLRSAISNGTAKLDWDKVRAIRALPEEQRKPDEIAVRYGISRRAVQDVIKGDSWRELVAGASVFSWRPGA